MENISITIYDHPQKKGITLLKVKGEIDTKTAPELADIFIQILRDKKFKLVVDLKNVSYISSAGWSIFVSELKRIRNLKGDVILAGMNAAVHEVYELLEFNIILKAFPTVETAVKQGFVKA
jgi:anti-sigma B factor antagonist